MITTDMNAEDWSLITAYLLAGYTILWGLRHEYLLNIDLGVRLIFESALIGFTSVYIPIVLYRVLKENLAGDEVEKFDSIEMLRAILIIAGVAYTTVTLVQISGI